MDDNKEKLTAKFAKMDQNFFNPVCLWHIQQTTIAYFVYWPAQSLTKINYCCSTCVFYSTIKAVSILLLSFWPSSFLVLPNVFGPPTMVAAVVDFKDHGYHVHEFVLVYMSKRWVHTIFQLWQQLVPRKGNYFLQQSDILLVKRFSHYPVVCNLLINDKVHNFKD